MPKPLLYDGRADFRGGRNTSVSTDLLNPTELEDSTNARLSNAAIGAFMKRTGSQRMHVNALPTPILGLTQWDAPSGKQTVVIAGDGKLYYKAQGIGGNFTQITPGTLFSTASGFVDFAPFRSNAAGAPLVLYIADGANLYSWDGTATVTKLTPTNSAPQAQYIRAYHTRLFAVDARFTKALYWSRMGDATNWAAGLSTDGGTSLIDTLTGNAIGRLEIVGSSLLPFTDLSVMRFTGFSSDDIVITEGTGGVSADIGVAGPRAATRVEQVIAFMTELGPYFAVETGVQAYGTDVETDFNNADRTKLSKSIVAHHNGRREIWNFYSKVGDSKVNQNALVYNTRLQNWMGPFTYPFGIVAATDYIDASGAAWLIAAGDDGYVRHMDIGAKDDVLSDGTGGSAYTMTVVLNSFMFSVGPGVAKGLKRINVQANLPATTALHTQTSFDGRNYVDWGAITGIGAFSTNYRVDASDVGHRLSLKFTDASTDIPLVNGVVVEAYNYARP